MLRDEDYEVTLESGGKKIKMTDKQFSDLANGKAPKGVSVETNVFYGSIKVTTKYDEKIGQVTTITAECQMLPTDVARILNLQRQGVPMKLTLGSPQAQMDLRLDTVNAITGEIMAEAVRLTSGK